MDLESVLPQVLRWRSRQTGIHQPVNSYLWNGYLIDPAVDTPNQLAVSHVLVTHVQEEHIAGALTYADSPLYIPAGDEYLCQGEAAYETGIQEWEEPWDWSNRGNFQGHLAGARNERPPVAALSVAKALNDGDELPGLKVVSTPGHGKHAITLIAEIDTKRIAFCGDLICGHGQLWNWFDCDWDYGLEAGQRTLLASARKLLELHPDVLLPAHGEPIFDAQNALMLLIERLRGILENRVPISGTNQPLNFDETEEPWPGWRQLSPHLYQWKEGNCALVTSQDGVGLLVDDGLCHWLPIDKRAADHRQVMSQVKAKLGLSRIEAVIVTHYHGDHIYNIPMLREEEGNLQVITLDTVASVLDHPERFNLAAALWWYGTPHDRIAVDQRLGDGEAFRWHEFEFQIYHLGGQTYYHCGIDALIDGARVSFAGDAFFGTSVECEPVLCFNDAEPRSRGWSHAIQTLREHRPELIVCGHGSAIKNPAALLEAKAQAWQVRLRQFDSINARSHDRAFFDPYWSKNHAI